MFLSRSCATWLSLSGPVQHGPPGHPPHAAEPELPEVTVDNPWGSIINELSPSAFNRFISENNAWTYFRDKLKFLSTDCRLDCLACVSACRAQGGPAEEGLCSPMRQGQGGATVSSNEEYRDKIFSGEGCSLRGRTLEIQSSPKLFLRMDGLRSRWQLFSLKFKSDGRCFLLHIHLMRMTMLRMRMTMMTRFGAAWSFRPSPPSLPSSPLNRRALSPRLVRILDDAASDHTFLKNLSNGRILLTDKRWLVVDHSRWDLVGASSLSSTPCTRLVGFKKMVGWI